MDTTNILFICGGAFSGLEQVIKRRISHSSMGFEAKLRTSALEEVDQSALFDQVEPDDLVRFGLIPEFIGRFPVVVSTKCLTVDSLVPHSTSFPSCCHTPKIERLYCLQKSHQISLVH